MKVFTIPNALSFLRIPLTLLFLLNENAEVRCLAILSAMLTDWLDGFLARKYHLFSKIGTLLDPLTDKFFVSAILLLFIHEDRLTTWQAITMLCRDYALLFFGIYLIRSKRLLSYPFHAIISGKVTTFFQFIVLICLTFQIKIPNAFFSLFILLGFLALFELLYRPIPKEATEKGT